MAEIYQDRYERTFASLDDAQQEYELFKENGSVSTVANVNLRVEVIGDETECPASVEPCVFEDTQKNSKLLLRTPTGIIPVREHAVAHVLDRAGSSCAAIAKKRTEHPEEFARDVTRNFTVMGGESTIYTSFGKVSCMGSDKYASLEVADLTEILLASLNGRALHPEFLSGGISHEYTQLRLVLQNDDVMDAYQKEVELHACDERELRPVVTLVSSNAKNSSATLVGALMDDRSKVRIPVGSLGAVVHKGKTDKRLEAFAGNCDALFSRFCDVTEAMNRLLKIELEYPVSVFRNAGKKLGFCRDSIIPYFTQAYNLYVSIWGTAPTNAHEVYWGLAETIRFMEENHAPIALVVQAEELLMEALAPRFGWAGFDTKEVK